MKMILSVSVAAMLLVVSIGGIARATGTKPTEKDKKRAKGDEAKMMRVLFSKTPDRPKGMPEEALQAKAAPNAAPGPLSKLVGDSISTITVTYFDPKVLEGEQPTENFLRRLLTTPKGQVYTRIPWAQMLRGPTVATTLEFAEGKTGVWLVWDGGESVYCAYKDGAGRWWFGVWFQDAIPR